MGYGAEILGRELPAGSAYSELHRALWHRHFTTPEPDEELFWSNVDALSVGERAFILTNEFSGEVHNGGFDQYFLNGGFHRARATVQALELFGFVEMAGFLRRAIELGRIPDPVPPDYEYDSEEPERPYGTPSPASTLDTEFYRAHTNKD